MAITPEQLRQAVGRLPAPAQSAREVVKVGDIVPFEGDESPEPVVEITFTAGAWLERPAWIFEGDILLDEVDLAKVREMSDVRWREKVARYVWADAAKGDVQRTGGDAHIRVFFTLERVFQVDGEGYYLQPGTAVEGRPPGWRLEITNFRGSTVGHLDLFTGTESPAEWPGGNKIVHSVAQRAMARGLLKQS